MHINTYPLIKGSVSQLEPDYNRRSKNWNSASLGSFLGMNNYDEEFLFSNRKEYNPFAALLVLVVD